MKKFLSIGAGLVVGLILCLVIGYTITMFSTKETNNTSLQFSWNKNPRFGSGIQWTGSNPRWSDQFLWWSWTNRTGNFMRWSWAMLGTGRRTMNTWANISAEELFNQDVSQQ